MPPPPNTLNPLKGSTRRGPFLSLYLFFTVLFVSVASYFWLGIGNEWTPTDYSRNFIITVAIYLISMSFFNLRRLHDGGYSGWLAYFVFGVTFIETLMLNSGYTLWFFIGFSFCLVFVPHQEDLSKHTDIFK